MYGLNAGSENGETPDLRRRIQANAEYRHAAVDIWAMLRILTAARWTWMSSKHIITFGLLGGHAEKPGEYIQRKTKKSRHQLHMSWPGTAYPSLATTLISNLLSTKSGRQKVKKTNFKF